LLDPRLVDPRSTLKYVGAYDSTSITNKIKEALSYFASKYLTRPKRDGYQTQK